jgi:hypothetical protein
MDTEHRPLAAASYNECWILVENPSRTPNEDVALLTNAFASRYHWSKLDNPQSMIIADWMVSRAAAATGYGQLSVDFAQRAVDAATEQFPDWLVASCAEGLARAYRALGESATEQEWTQRAQKLVAAIADVEDRELIASQLAQLTS